MLRQLASKEAAHAGYPQGSALPETARGGRAHDGPDLLHLLARILRERSSTGCAVEQLPQADRSDATGRALSTAFRFVEEHARAREVHHAALIVQDDYAT